MKRRKRKIIINAQQKLAESESENFHKMEISNKK